MSTIILVVIMKTFFFSARKKGRLFQPPLPSESANALRSRKSLAAKWFVQLFFTLILHTPLNLYTTCKLDRSVKSSAAAVLLLLWVVICWH